MTSSHANPAKARPRVLAAYIPDTPPSTSARSLWTKAGQAADEPAGLCIFRIRLSGTRLFIPCIDPLKAGSSQYEKKKPALLALDGAHQEGPQ